MKGMIWRAVEQRDILFQSSQKLHTVATNQTNWCNKKTMSKTVPKIFHQRSDCSHHRKWSYL